MSITTKTFEVAVDNERAALAFDMRAAVVDFLRTKVKSTLSRAEDAEVDRQTALRRFSLTYAAAAKGYRLPRAIPAALLNWAAYAEMNAIREGFPAASPGSVGSFDKESVMTLPGDVVLIKMGGVTFAGTTDGGKPSDLFEIRVARNEAGKFIATFVCGRFDGGDGEGVPVPVSPDMVDA